MLAPALPESNFRVEAIEHMSFDGACADVVVSNTVLHFARDDAHFESMLHGSWRVLKPGGLFFCRLGSSIGRESRVEQIQGRCYRSPDGSERYLVDEALLGSITERLGAELADLRHAAVCDSCQTYINILDAEHQYDAIDLDAGGC